jgi:hypothetical protein
MFFISPSSGGPLKEIGPTAARFPLKIQPLSFQWVVFFINSTQTRDVAKKA